MDRPLISCVHLNRTAAGRARHRKRSEISVAGPEDSRAGGRAAEQGWLFPEESGDRSAAVSTAAGSGPVFETPAFTVVTQPAQLEQVLPELHAAPVLACDTETTGLDWRSSALRLVQLATADHVYLFDLSRVPPRTVFSLFFGERLWLFHNAKFDLKFLVSAGCPWPARVFDTMLANQVLKAGRRVRHSLEEVVAQELGCTLPKNLQSSDWSSELSHAQLAYAARDVAALWPVYLRQRVALSAAGLQRAADIEFRCVKALAWLELAGIGVDAAYWLARVEQDEAELKRLAGRLDVHARGLGRAVNWASSRQIRAVFHDLNIPLPNTRAATLKNIDHPIAKLVLDHKELSKRVSTYGRGVIDSFFKADSGRMYPVYYQNGAASGRMSCGGPNIQQIPKAPAFRSCFRAEPGCALVKADYSQVELRIAAALADDATMLQAFRDKTDLHALTASRMLRLPIERVEARHRQLAKSVNFGLLYGMGVNGLRLDAQAKYGIRMSAQDAANYHRAFFETYRGVADWHQRAKQQSEQARRSDHGVETRTLVGRRFLGVRHFNALLNIPVQGTGGDGLKLALARLFEDRDRLLRATPVACVHDEIVVEAACDEVDDARRWVSGHMAAAMQEIVNDRVPIEVDTTVGKDWAGTPLDDRSS